MPGNDYTSKRLTIAQKGLNLQLEPTLMKGMYSPYMKNMLIDKGNLRKFLGYSRLGKASRLLSRGGSEVGCSLRAFVDYLGTPHLLAFTDKTAFVSVIDDDEASFININPGETVEACTSGWVTDDADHIDVDHVTTPSIYGSSVRLSGKGIFSGSDELCHVNFSSIDLSDYTHICFWFQVNISGLLFGEPLYLVISESADGAKAGDYVTIEIDTTGITADTWYFFCEEVDLSSMNAAVSIGIWNDSGISWNSSRKVYFDQIRAITLLEHDFDSPTFGGGIYTFDEVTDTEEFDDSDGKALAISLGTHDSGPGSTAGLYTWDAVPNSLSVLNLGVSSLRKVTSIIEFWNHFFIAGYVTGINSLGSLGHAAIGDINDWESDGSGFYTLTDTKGKVLRMTKNDYTMNIYSEFSISRGVWYGSYILFVFPCIMENLGLLGHNALTATEHGDYFIGSDKRFYFMPVGQKPIPIGDDVDRAVFEDATAWMRWYFACGNYSNLHRILFAIPSEGGTYGFPVNVYAYNYVNKSWEFFVFDDTIRCFETAVFDYGTTDPCFEVATCFIDRFCNVYHINEPSTGLMDATAIACEYQTEDITIDDEHSNARWKWFTFTAKSTIADSTVTVQYSIDNGSSWTSFDASPVSLTAAWVTYRLPLDVVSRVIRFRFTQTSGDLQVKANMFYGFSQDTEV